MRSWTLRIVIPLVAGILGMLLVLGAQHLVQDHQNLHALLNLVAAAQQKK